MSNRTLLFLIHGGHSDYKMPRAPMINLPLGCNINRELCPTTPTWTLSYLGSSPREAHADRLSRIYAGGGSTRGVVRPERAPEVGDLLGVHFGYTGRSLRRTNLVRWFHLSVNFFTLEKQKKML